MRTKQNQSWRCVQRAILLPVFFASWMCLHGCGKQAPPQSRSATPDPELADADLKFVSRLLREIALQDFSVVLYSLDPGVAVVDQKKERLTFHDHLVLGAAEIRGSTAKSNLLTSLLVNIPEKHPDYAINCFFPGMASGSFRAERQTISSSVSSVNNCGFMGRSSTMRSPFIELVAARSIRS